MGVANSALKREGDLPTLESHGVGSLFGLVQTSTRPAVGQSTSSNRERPGHTSKFGS